MSYYYYHNRQLDAIRSDDNTGLMIITSIIIICLVGLSASYAFDKSMDNKDTMLCNSAKTSGNIEYLAKCQCYYDSNDIRCLQDK